MATLVASFHSIGRGGPSRSSEPTTAYFSKTALSSVKTISPTPTSLYRITFHPALTCLIFCPQITIGIANIMMRTKIPACVPKALIYPDFWTHGTMAYKNPKATRFYSFMSATPQPLIGGGAGIPWNLQPLPKRLHSQGDTNR